MFRLFANKHVESGDLLTSALYTEETFYNAFLADLKRCRNEVIIESPYMTTARVNKLLPDLRRLTRRGVKIRVNTRFPGHHDTLLRTQA